MNIIKKELRLGFKPFLIWLVGLFVLDIVGLIKFTGVSEGGASMSAIIDQIPRVVQALIGIVGINIETLSGYYAILAYFVLMCGCVYAIYLAGNAMNREIVDKTYEFIFTKPRSRAAILSMKLIVGVIYLAGFTLVNIVFSYIGLSILNINESIFKEIIYFSIAMFLICLLYYAVTAFICSICTRPEKGTFYGNVFFLVTFIIGVVVDMIEKPGIVRILSPMKYFPPIEILQYQLSIFYIIAAIIIIVISSILAYSYFNKRDLKAVN
ncbi:ABC transporter permease [Anaerorhabdus sp.]|uniref:ABC transporter permease n=1 Tax=Anaerorhabdus sp. TaxID=1872524 RepID=UPI002FC8485F